MTRTTNARLAGGTFLLYIAVGITQMALSRDVSAEVRVQVVEKRQTKKPLKIFTLDLDFF
jgi:hypothetical protein